MFEQETSPLDTQHWNRMTEQILIVSYFIFNSCFGDGPFSEGLYSECLCF